MAQRSPQFSKNIDDEKEQYDEKLKSIEQEFEEKVKREKLEKGSLQYRLAFFTKANLLHAEGIRFIELVEMPRFENEREFEQLGKCEFTLEYLKAGKAGYDEAIQLMTWLCLNKENSRYLEIKQYFDKLAQIFDSNEDKLSNQESIQNFRRVMTFLKLLTTHTKLIRLAAVDNKELTFAALFKKLDSAAILAVGELNRLQLELNKSLDEVFSGKETVFSRAPGFREISEFRNWSNAQIIAALEEIIKIEDPEDATLIPRITKCSSVLKAQTRQLELIHRVKTACTPENVQAIFDYIENMQEVTSQQLFSGSVRVDTTALRKVAERFSAFLQIVAQEAKEKEKAEAKASSRYFNCSIQ